MATSRRTESECHYMLPTLSLPKAPLDPLHRRTFPKMSAALPRPMSVRSDGASPRRKQPMNQVCPGWLARSFNGTNCFFVFCFFFPMELFGVSKKCFHDLPWGAREFQTIRSNSLWFWNEEFYVYIMFVWRKPTTDHCCSLRMSRQVRKAMNRPWLPAETLLEQSELYRSRMSSAPSDFFSIDNEPLGFVVI